MPPDAPDASSHRSSIEDVLLESARLHAMRASLLRIEAENARREPPRLGRRLLHSRAGHRVRFALLLARRTVRSLAEDGAAETLARLGRRLLPGLRQPSRRVGEPERRAATALDPAHALYRLPVGVPAGRRFRHRVLIIAELSIPQCAKYRVWQKKEHFERLGIPCTVVAWQRIPEALSLLQTHTLAILYRVPGFDGPLDLIDEAARVGVETIWEIDDLIFDLDLYAANTNLRHLPPALVRELMTGASLNRTAMLACDRTIGSTAVLSELMEQATGKPSHVVANGLDAETLAYAASAVAGRSWPDPDRIVIVYGSGTLTHDADFALAAPALLRLLGEDERVSLRIVGTLELDPAFDRFTSRIERLETTNFKAYLAALASADISLAPLEATVFNEAKSNIKLIEAAIVGLPSICSPRREFLGAIEHGEDGFLAETGQDWYDALHALAGDPALRAGIGSRARARALSAYSPAMAATAVRPLAALVPRFERRTLRILAVNIFFAPRSFGGATVIAEEMAQRLGGRDDTEIFVFTSHNFPAPQYTLRRYVARGTDVIGAALPNTHDDILNFDDPEMAGVFADVLAAIEPDIVHFHAIQHFGAGIVRACQRAGIPYVITVHDAWWLCQRQFMVRADNTYCYQTTIDLKVCERCLPGIHHLQSRMDILRQALLGATTILSPSASHGALYLANGVPAERLVVNRNGVRLGFSNFRQWRDWKVKGRVNVVPAYRQDTMDDFFESIDVLLFPSQWKESFGLAVREALVRSVWVIATDSGGAAEDIVAGVNGTLIPMGNDPGPLTAAVTDLLERSAMFDSFDNRFKSQVATLDDQAIELRAILARSVLVGGGAAMSEQQQQ